MLYVLALLGTLLLAILYRQMPNRKMFVGLCVLLLAAGATVYINDRGEQTRRAVSEAEYYRIVEQQNIFAAWYAAYQKYIEQLDRNWQIYHDILAELKREEIDLQTAYVRLVPLADDARQLADKIAQEQPPPAMDDEAYSQINSILAKTRVYAEAQFRTITLTRDAADPSKVTESEPTDRRRVLEDVMIRESPAGLFIAKEVTALKYYLTVQE